SIYDIIFFIFCFFFFFFFSSRRRHTRSKRDWSSDVCSSDLIYTFKGIAPNANLINLRALDQNGSGTDGTVISAIQEAIQLKSMYNIRVINLSLSLSAARSLRATNSIPFAKPSRRPGKRESWLSSRQEIQDAIT